MKKILEALSNEDVEKLSELSLDETDTGKVLSLFELIDEKDKVRAFDLIHSIFDGKELVKVEKEDKEEKKSEERYLRCK